MKHERVPEPPSCLQTPMFMVGQDSLGHWVVQNLSGVCGGLFVDRTAALGFVRSENGNRPHAYVAVSGVLELDMTRGVSAPQRQTIPDIAVSRKVA